MKTEIMTVTPKWAETRLAELDEAQRNGFRQRPVRERAVQRYAQDMKAGKWKLTHQGLAFDTAGHLLDGQNRLWAVVRANVNVQMTVTTGLRSDDLPMDVIDLGAPRTVWQALQISHGYGGAAVEMQALARGLGALAISMPKRIGIEGRKHSVQISTQEALFILDELQFKNDLERLATLVPQKRMRQAPFATPWVLYHRKYPKQADKFAVAYFTLEEQVKGSPALALTRYLANSTTKTRRLFLSNAKVVANCLKMHHDGELAGETGVRPSNEAFSWLMRLNEELIDAIYRRLME